MPEIKEKDYVLIKGKYYLVELLQHFQIGNESVIKKPTLVYDYEDCPDTYYSYVHTIEEDRDKIDAIYRETNGELKPIWKKGE